MSVYYELDEDSKVMIRGSRVIGFVSDERLHYTEPIEMHIREVVTEKGTVPGTEFVRRDLSIGISRDRVKFAQVNR